MDIEIAIEAAQPTFEEILDQAYQEMLAILPLDFN